MSGEIRDDEAYLAAAHLKRLERFAECFPRKITMGDIDGCVELNGHVLIVEFKRLGQEVQPGQARCLAVLAHTHHVLVYWGDGSGDCYAACAHGPGDHERRWTPTPCKPGDEVAFVRAWAAWAESQPCGVHAS